MKKVLVVGQTPPPYGGQAISIQLMLDGNYKNLQFFHVRMAFSREMDEIGKFRWRKVLHLVVIILSIIYSHFRYRIPILYYVPAGPERIPMYRDIAILVLTRWLFKKTVFQFRAAGISELYDRLTTVERILFRIAYFKPDLALRLSEFAPPDGENLMAKKNFIVSNGLEDYYPEFDKTKRNKNSVPVILYVGVLRESKGIMVLLETCRKLKDSGSKFKAKLMGKFESRNFKNKVETFVNNNSLREYIEFLGVRIGAVKWQTYLEADIFVFPSFYQNEAMPRVVLEAMSFEVPVVATYWRGIPSLVEDGKSGFLVPINDSKVFADKIKRLITDPNLRKSMGRCGREIYLEKFTAEKFWNSIEDTFLSLSQ